MVETEDKREFHRGDVWWFRDENSYRHEYGNSRPGVVVSSERGCKNSPTVQVVLLTTTTKWGVINVPISSGSKNQTAMCGAVQTFSKERAERYIYSVTPKELAEIDRGLAVVFGLCELDKPVDAGLEEKLERLKDEVEAQKIELAMYQKLYEKTLDQLVTIKFEFDVTRKATIGVSPSVAPVKKEQMQAPGYELVDINRCGLDDLKNIGVSPSVARNIIAARPFMKVDDLRIVPGMTQISYGIVSKKVTVGDTSEYCKQKKKPASIEPKKVSGKVNVNLVKTANELTKLTGMCGRTTNGIIKYREEHGKFACLEDLLKTPAFGATAMKRYGHLLEV